MSNLTNLRFIAVSGYIASGKTTFCRYAVETYGGLAFSAADVFGDGGTREECAARVEEAIEQGGPGTIFRATLAAFHRAVAEGYDGPRIVYMDGMRLIHDLFAMWGAFPAKSLLFWMETEDQIRYERYCARNRFPGDDAVTFEDFMALNEHAHERDLPVMRGSANHIVDNASEDAFEASIDREFTLLGIPPLP